MSFFSGRIWFERIIPYSIHSHESLKWLVAVVSCRQIVPSRLIIADVYLSYEWLQIPVVKGHSLEIIYWKKEGKKR
jgi:hypothetical protein